MLAISGREGPGFAYRFHTWEGANLTMRRAVFWHRCYHWCASLALPFEAPKLSAMVLSSVDPNEFARALDRAISRSGKREEMKVIDHIPQE
jgi:hypothetical protein